jgi:hypothetical protein
LIVTESVIIQAVDKAEKLLRADVFDARSVVALSIDTTLAGEGKPRR